MKLFTINQLRFAVFLAIFTIMFRYGLSSLLTLHMFSEIWIIAVIYGALIFSIGWIFGKKDNESLRIYDIGFRFHLTTYLICASITELWFLFKFNSALENIKNVHLMVIFWGIGILIHFIFFLISRRNAISGMKKSEIFD